MATCSPGDCLILPRNSHKSAISTLVLSGAIPKYIIPQYNYDWDIASGVLPSQGEEAKGNADNDKEDTTVVNSEIVDKEVSSVSQKDSEVKVCEVSNVYCLNAICHMVCYVEGGNYLSVVVAGLFEGR
ncbi:hypothetical protein LWI28_009593 [Acer negundo]|uniref:Orn/Lys/Arg decarboxylases family 1 pyridoxal-P attachment site domain-containing protein n=1 Tax=Acer negundo TaxID=4023 RepID=A0AAD5IPL3_ACENE|nr:hypothetical protein LWI28_009593 [Acer negundo]